MKIVILDAYTTNPGDISWAPVEALGECKIYEHTRPEEILDRAKEAEIIITNKTYLGENIIKSLPDLKYIGLLSTGTNAVDIAAAEARGIPVTNVPGYSTDTVAQLVFGYILQFCNHVKEYSDSVHRGDWSACRDFTYMLSPVVELRGKTIGIFGYGAIGRRVADIADAFGMNIIVNSRTKPAKGLKGEFVPFEELLQRSDFLTLHCPLTEKTRGIIDISVLKRMKPTAYLINTSRGPVVNQNDLAYALNKGLIAGAAVDVMEVEPPPADSPLLGCKNCIITPHIAWASKEARIRLIEIVADNIEAFQSGAPQNLV